MRPAVISLAVAAVTTWSSAQAAQVAQAGQVAVYGPGVLSCGRFLTDYQGGSTAYTSWVTGYLSAYNDYSPTKTFSILHNADIDGAMRWIVNYCSSHPLDSFHNAAGSLVRELGRQAK
jgi:hypothetical protein